MAHHGNEDATGWQFVLLARPQWAVISTSSVEKPETPSSKVLWRLKDVKASVGVTQDAGVRILLTTLCVHVFHLGLAAVWICMALDNITRGALLGARFLGSRWKRPLQLTQSAS